MTSYLALATSLIILLTLSSAFRAEEGDDASSEVDLVSDVNATVRQDLCCALRVTLGKYECERDIYSHSGRACKPGTEHWNVEKARQLCAGLQKSQKYYLSSITTNSYIGPSWSMTQNCQCEGGKGPYQGKAVVRKGRDGAIVCRSQGPLGATHCNIGGRFTSSCACLPAAMTCAIDDGSLLFAPQVKKKGMITKCGWSADKRTAAPYMEALKHFGAVDENAEPQQKTIGSENEEGWTFKEKYGGQVLTASGFCGAAPDEDMEPSGEAGEVVGDK